MSKISKTTSIKTIVKLPSLIIGALLLVYLLVACGNAGAASASTPSTPLPTTGSTSATSNNNSTAVNTGTTSTGSGSSAAIGAKAAGPFTALRMLDQTYGWALSKSAIFKTQDGGAHWINVAPARGIPADSVGTFRDFSHAWIASVSAQEVSNTVDILRTSDGGKTWQHSSFTDNAVAVFDPPHFVNLQLGWLEIINYGGPGAGNESAAIYHTSNGGQTWSKEVESKKGFGLSGFKTGISFKDALNGWATGYDASNKALLYVTHDGGNTWQPQALPDLPGAIGTAATIFSFQTTPPVFFGNNGLLPVRVNGQLEANRPVQGMLLYVTNDGGNSWFSYWKTELNALSPFTPDNLYIVNTQHAWGSDNQTNVIYATADGGKSWQKVANSIGSIKAFSFVDNSHGWAITANALWHTRDGGRTWQQVS